MYDERERESDGGAAGFYWGADGSRDPFWWSGWSGLRLAGTFATLGANGLHIHPPALAPQSRAQRRELRTAWAQAARVDADASMSGRTAIRTARRAAEATAAEEEAGSHGQAAEEDVAEEEAAAEEEELLLGCI